MKKIYKYILVMIILMPSFLVNVYGQDTGTITANFSDTNYGNISGMDVNIYKVADYDKSSNSDYKLGDFTLCKDFEECELEFLSLEEAQSDIELAAVKLDKYVKNNENIKPLNNHVSCNEGKVEFNNLGDGLYLINAIYRGDTFTVETLPLLVVLPAYKNNSFDYQINLKPKLIVNKLENKDDYTVLKLWKDNNNENGLRPDSIKVELYHNKELYDTVELNALMNWSYTWNDLDTNVEWSVKEINLDDNYICKVVNNGTQFVIENTLKENDSIKTGDNTPIALLVVGMIIGAMGILKLLKD